MSDRIDQAELVRRLAARHRTSEKNATRWLNNILHELYEAIKAGESITLKGFGGFYVRQEKESWVFRFNPGQKLRALFEWSSTYKGKL